MSSYYCGRGIGEEYLRLRRTQRHDALQEPARGFREVSREVVFDELGSMGANSATSTTKAPRHYSEREPSFARCSERPAAQRGWSRSSSDECSGTGSAQGTRRRLSDLDNAATRRSSSRSAGPSRRCDAFRLSRIRDHGNEWLGVIGRRENQRAATAAVA